MLASLEAKLVGLMVGLMLVFLFGLGCYEYGKSVQRAQSADAQAVIINAARLANDKLKQQLEVQHVQAENTIAALRSTPVPRVYIHSRCSEPQPAKSSMSAITSSGVLPTTTESILDADRQRTWDNLSAAEQELEQCRVVKNWAAQACH